MGNKVNGGILLQGGDSAQLLPLTGTRVNATAGSASTSEAALPAGHAGLFMVRATGPMAIRFGTTGMGAAAVDANSLLFPAGEAPVRTDPTATHFRVIRASSSDASVQIESVSML